MEEIFALESELRNLIISHEMDRILLACIELELKYNEIGSDAGNSDFYSIYLAVSIVYDLDGARHLWRRLPQHLKSGNTELNALWKLARHLWQRDKRAVFETIAKHSWSEFISPIVQEIIISERKKQIILISKSYSSISIQNLSMALMLSREDTYKELIRLNWELRDSDLVLVRPVRDNDRSGNTIADDTRMLAQLSEYVCHLEKRSLKVDITGKNSSSSDFK